MPPRRSHGGGGAKGWAPQGGPTLKTELETLYIGGEEGGKGEGDPASSGITCLRCTNTVPHLSLWGEGAVLSRLRCLRRRLCTSRPSAEARLARLATKLEPLVPLPAARQNQSPWRREIVRLVLPTGLVLKYGVFDARGSTGVVAAACTVCQREIGQISGGVRRDRGTTGSVSTVKDGWRFQPPWWAAQRVGRRFSDPGESGTGSKNMPFG